MHMLALPIRMAQSFDMGPSSLDLPRSSEDLRHDPMKLEVQTDVVDMPERHCNLQNATS